MVDNHIQIYDHIMDIISIYYNNTIPSLIHIYDHGICITQNINSTSNINIYINKEYLQIHNITQNISFFNIGNINNLQNFKIYKENNNTYITYNNHKTKLKL